MAKALNSFFFRCQAVEETFARWIPKIVTLMLTCHMFIGEKQQHYWLMVWNMCFPIYWEQSSQLTHIFRRVFQPPSRLKPIQKSQLFLLSLGVMAQVMGVLNLWVGDLASGNVGPLWCLLVDKMPWMIVYLYVDLYPKNEWSLIVTRESGKWWCFYQPLVLSMSENHES